MKSSVMHVRGWLFPVIVILCLVVAWPVRAERAGVDLGLELQVYPTGVIPGLRAEWSFTSTQSLLFRLGYQRIDHQDFGVQDEEEGEGAGLSLGYRWYRHLNRKAWSLSARTDLWFNTIDWEDTNGDSGTTRVTVLQPTVGLGYSLLYGPDFVLTPTLSYGREINIETDGAEVGEGEIWLLGLEWGVRF